MKITRLKYFAAAAFFMLLAGCVKDYSSGGNAGEAIVTLNLGLPRGADATRSIAAEPDATGENRIDEVAVLALVEKNGQWVYDYTADIVSKTQTGKDVTVKARVTGTSTPQQFVVLANAAAELAAAAPIRYEKIADIEERLVCSTGGGQWPANNNGDGAFTPFPMFARTEAQVITEDKTIASYQLLRMVARIDVTLKGTIDNFTLTEAYLFNYKTAGYVSYGDRLSGTAVTSAAVPASGDHTGDPILEPTVMYAADSDKILSSIYTFESPAITSESEKITKTALVVGGYYDGSTTKSYYRIDLKTTDDASSNISSGILRNHSYNVEIQTVSGEGYEYPKEAYLGASRLSAVVVPWNDAVQKTVFDGQYFLKVDEDVFVVPGSETTAACIAETDYDTTTQGFPKGLQVEAAEIEYTSGDDGWLTLSGGANGDLTRTVQITAATNLTDEDRTATVYVHAGNMTKTLYITQLRISPTTAGTLVSGTSSYVGAFWRAAQTGERLIRIPVNMNSAGKWRVQVLYYGDFRDDDIVFDTEMSDDVNIGWRTDVSPNESEVADMNAAANDALYRVAGTDRMATGVAEDGDYIFFRIGLKSTWTPSAAKPARYAVILLEYNDYKKYQKLWLRQGEESDYLMRAGDKSIGNDGATYRENTIMYTPYNLTAADMTDDVQYIQLDTNGGAFTDYPSKAGALFQFTSNYYVRYAYHPAFPNTTTRSPWNSNEYNWGDEHETCPEGYRRPINDGTTGAQMFQSLWANLASTSNITNSIWGYYADGFFDRRLIGRQTADYYNGKINSAVAMDTKDVAYNGRLFYNPNIDYNASIFFPAAGYIYYVNAFYSPGDFGYYWSSSVISNGYSYAMGFNSGAAASVINTSRRSSGFSVRCVVE